MPSYPTNLPKDGVILLLRGPGLRLDGAHSHCFFEQTRGPRVLLRGRPTCLSKTMAVSGVAPRKAVYHSHLADRAAISDPLWVRVNPRGPASKTPWLARMLQVCVHCPAVGLENSTPFCLWGPLGRQWTHLLSLRLVQTVSLFCPLPECSGYMSPINVFCSGLFGWVQYTGHSPVWSQMLRLTVCVEIVRTWACSGVCLRNPLKEQNHAVSKSVIWAGSA